MALANEGGSVSILVPESPGRAERYIIRALTGVALSEAHARAVMPRIVEHKYFLSQRLGRDVGLKVAAVDYLENVEPADALKAA